MADEGKPLSLNERLAMSLSRSRPTSHRCTEIRVRKVKLEGRRRLCKLSSRPDSGDQGIVFSPASSPGEEPDTGGSSFQNVVDDPSSRLESLSRSRPTSHRCPEIRVRKVKLEGRRRLCKLSSRPDSRDQGIVFSPASSPGEDPDDGGSSFQNVVDDLSSRLESLSVKKLNHSHPPESEPEFKSANSSLSSSSSEERGDKRIEKIKGNIMRPMVPEQGKGTDIKGFKAKAVEQLVLGDDSEEDDCIFLGGGQKSELGESDNTLENSGVDSSEPIRMHFTGKGKDLRFSLPGKTAKILYPHQKEGLKWLWSLHCGGTGGILGDDMGLGKTMQISAFLDGLFHSNLVNRVLLVAPKTLLGHWIKELSVVGLSTRIREYSGTSPKVREYELLSVLKEGGILLTTYDIVRNNSKSIRANWYIDGDRDEDDIIWDYTILDEGHIIKNPNTQRSKSLFEIPSRHRIIISGTPIQNNLKELWALFHFCCPDILGGKDEFKIKYENPVMRGNDKHASHREKHVGSTVAKELRERIKPYFLRRLKSEVFLADNGVKNAKLSKKNEIIVWLKLTLVQRQLYEAFLKSEMVHSSVSGSPLAAIMILKKICDHPLLLTKRAVEGVREGMDTLLNAEELGMVEEMALNLANMTNHKDSLKLGEHVSCKLSFIMSLLENLIKEGHHILIFSQTRKMLNLLEESIISKRYSYLRIDGTTKISDREKTVKDFQGGMVPIFLLTSQVGGLGLTLTKADRVIVVDPAWNPSTDNQSVDRAYRIGQNRDVLVYRLMTCATVEEKIYKMQVFKGGLFRSATEQKEQTRYFSQKDIRDLFELPVQGFDVSLTQQQLYEEHDHHHTMDEGLKNHIEFLKSHGIAGVSHHSLLFSKTAKIPFVPENSNSESVKGNRIIRGSPSNSTVECADNYEVFAFNPKDAKLLPRAGSSLVQSEPKASPEGIAERILRLAQTLENKTLVSKLPDQGEKLRKQISELRKQQLEKSAESAADKQAHDRKQLVEFIDIDELSSDLQRIVGFTPPSNSQTGPP